MILYEKQSQQHFYHNNVSFSSLLANSFRVPSTIQVRTRCKPGGIGDGRQRHSARSTVPQPRTGKLETRKTSPSHKEDIQKSWEHFEPRKATHAFATVPRALQTSDGRFLEESGIIYPWLLQNMLCKLFFCPLHIPYIPQFFIHWRSPLLTFWWSTMNGFGQDALGSASSAECSRSSLSPHPLELWRLWMCGAEETSTQAAGFVCLGWGSLKLGVPQMDGLNFMENPNLRSISWKIHL